MAEDENFITDFVRGNFEYGAAPTQTSGYNPPPRLVSGAAPGGGGGQYWYEGNDLVDERGSRVRGPYDPVADARGVYANMTPEQRSYVFDVLQRKGFYGSRQPGVYSNDVYAIEEWLDYSNATGYTRSRSLEEMQRTIADVRGGGGTARRYRVSSPEDLKVVAKRVAQETIGRAFTDEEANKFVSAYQQREIEAQQAAYGGGIATDQPSADVFAQQFAHQIAPTEANGYKFLGYMNRIFQAAGGR